MQFSAEEVNELLGDFKKILTPVMKYLQVYEQGKNSSSFFHAVEHRAALNFI